MIIINGHTFLYKMVRSVGHIDVDDLAIHELTPLPGQPLNGAPALSEAPTDSFHYIGYAESTDLVHRTVINGINNPIASVFPATLTVNAQGVPATGAGTSQVTIPAHTAVVGNTQGFFAGRVYAPSATKFDDRNITVIFAGYHTQKPKNGLGDYRTIGRVSLHSSQHLVAVGQDNGGDGDNEADDH